MIYLSIINTVLLISLIYKLIDIKRLLFDIHHYCSPLKSRIEFLCNRNKVIIEQTKRIIHRQKESTDLNISFGIIAQAIDKISKREDLVKFLEKIEQLEDKEKEVNHE